MVPIPSPLPVIKHKQKLSHLQRLVTRPTLTGPWTKYTGRLVADSDTLALYNFDGNLNDSSGNGRNLGVRTGSILYTSTSIFDQSAFFTSLSYATSSDGVFNTGTGSVTWEAWINTTASNGVIISKGVGGTPRFLLVMLSGRPQSFFYDGQNANAVTAPVANTINDGQWHHVAGVADLTNPITSSRYVRLYIDGIETGTPNQYRSSGSMTNTWGLSVGAYSDGSQPFSGLIDQVRISNVARTIFPTVSSSNAWYVPYTGSVEIKRITFNNVSGRRKYSVASLINTRDWTYDFATQNLYVYNLAGNPTGTYSAIRGDTVFRHSVKYGIHSDIGDQTVSSSCSLAIAKLAAIAPKVCRFNLYWYLFQPNSSSVMNWATLDRCVTGLVAANIEPLFCFFGAPTWMTQVSQSQNSFYFLQYPTSSVLFDDYVAKYTNFITTLATRYSGSIRYWEIGNEVNTDAYWGPHQSASQYVQWYNAMYGAIKGVDPTANIAVAGLCTLYQIGVAGITGKEFLGQLYDLGVMPDNIALHPYPDNEQPPDQHIAGLNNFDDIGTLSDFMAANGNSNAKIWITENGWTTGGRPHSVTEEQQKAFHIRAMELVRDRYPQVSVYIVFNQYESISSGQLWGVLRNMNNGWVEKSSAGAVRQFFQTYNNY